MVDKLSFNVVNPCLGKQGEGNDLVCLLIHVDDVYNVHRTPSAVKENNHEFSVLKSKYTYTPEGLLACEA